MFDTHCHLDFVRESRSELIELLTKSHTEHNLLGCINIGLRHDTFNSLYERTKGICNIWYSVGNHPSEEFKKEPVLSDILEYAQQADVVAIGETGLDYYYDNVPKPIQKARFELQIQLAQDLNKPLIIHCRDALPDLLDILKYHDANNFVMHCFTGNAKEAEQCLLLGGFISYSGIVTFKNALENQAAAKITPIERLLIETDSPYLAPTPFRGKPNHPGMVKYVAAKIAELKGLELSEIAKITTKNACDFFQIELQDEAFKDN